MNDISPWPILELSDDDLLQEIHQILTVRAVGDPHGEDGDFAANLLTLPVGLRAMAATHWLDVSLTLDSITWHFGNFGEPSLIAETEKGLRTLGLDQLAECFVEARNLMLPLLASMKEDDEFSELLEQAGLAARGDEIDRRAWELNSLKDGESAIYDAWIRYARSNPEGVFENRKATH